VSGRALRIPEQPLPRSIGREPAGSGIAPLKAGQLPPQAKQSEVAEMPGTNWGCPAPAAPCAIAASASSLDGCEDS
jgi:hypothetical protein